MQRMPQTTTGEGQRWAALSSRADTSLTASIALTRNVGESAVDDDVTGGIDRQDVVDLERDVWRAAMANQGAVMYIVTNVWPLIDAVYGHVRVTLPAELPRVAAQRPHAGAAAVVVPAAENLAAGGSAAWGGSGAASVRPRRDRCPICQLPLLGSVYESLGQADSALVLFERYITTPYAERCIPTPYTLRALGGTSPAAGFDPFWLPVVFERLGALYERRGDTAKAIHYYGRLVDLWQDADPELQPRVLAARSAMRSLSAVR